MNRPKQEISLSFKISSSMKTKIDQECELENRSQAEMTKILIAESLLNRESKRNICKIL
jgi:hypothetical protein